MMDGDLLIFVAAGLAGTAETEDCSNLLRGEAKLSRPLDEAERPDVFLGIYTVTSLRSVRHIEKIDFLEIADRLNMDARAAGKLANRQTSHAKQDRKSTRLNSRH